MTKMTAKKVLAAMSGGMHSSVAAALLKEDGFEVAGIIREKNAIMVGAKEEVYGDELTASGLNWIAMEGLKQPIEVKAKIRYHHNESEAQVTPPG